MTVNEDHGRDGVPLNEQQRSHLLNVCASVAHAIVRCNAPAGVHYPEFKDADDAHRQEMYKLAARELNETEDEHGAVNSKQLCANVLASASAYVSRLYAL